METYEVSRVRAALRAGNSMPVIGDTPAGRFIVKLRGAAHGTAALVAEIVVAEIAEAIGLGVPARALIELHDDLVSDDRNDELAQLLGFSRGISLGFQWLPDARDLRPGDVEGVDRDTAVRTLWLDWLGLKPDRPQVNSKILVSHRGVCLLHHAASPGFHH